jgi:hypothetical protein
MRPLDQISGLIFPNGIREQKVQRANLFFCGALVALWPKPASQRFKKAQCL